MNSKILKYQLFSLFSLSLITLFIFYYRDILPDNYLSISSNSSHGFFSYYGISFLNFIYYYSGPWVLIPCVFYTAFYVFLYSKRASWFDILNVLFLCVFSVVVSFYLKPALLGGGLVQIFSSSVSPFASFLIIVTSLTAFMWGTFREGFTENVKNVFGEIKNPGKSLTVSQLRLYFDNCLTSFRQNFQRNNVPADISKGENAQGQVHSKEIALVEDVIVHLEPVLIANYDLGFDENHVDDNLNGQSDDTIIVKACALSSSSSSSSEVDLDVAFIEKDSCRSGKFSEDKYYDLVKGASYRHGDHKFSQPEDKYFLDIISKIQLKLGEFKIQGRIINILKGPVVDTFEWELGAGEKVSRLTVTAEDLSLALSGSPIRMVYPMKGRTTVGIEVPRNPRDFIFLDEIISSKDYTHTAHQLPLAMGKDAFGEPVVVDLASMPHMLVAGSTGAGKSVFINSILVSLLIKKSPNQMKLILIDPKQLELALYARLPHLLMPVITEAKTATTSLLWACQEMERRYSIMTEFGVRNIEGFNHKLKRADRMLIDKIRKFYEYSTEDTYELPYIVIIVDEFADLILTQKGKEIETHICRLAAKARAAGVHLILATQRPSVDVITGLIKSNFPTRVSFRVTSSTDSRTILNAMGAEKLLGKGDMLYKQGVDTTRIHSAYVEEDEIELLTAKLAEMAPSFDPHIMEFLETGGEEESEANLVNRDNGESGERDDKYEEAVRVVVEHRSASASLLQRRLGVGYNRAANLIEEMESKGVVGPAQGSKPRKVLLGSESLT
jgi:S-DNA-T family DNA segregation ATPase FtsK/SpoIIIE